MTTKNLPWFRMYTDSVDDEKLRLIAPSDRWYFFALLCCKGKGIIDEGGPLLKRKVAVKLGLQVDELEEVARRLAEVGLIDRDTLQPFGWEDRQFKSDSDSTAAARKRRQRERERGTPAQGPEDGHAHVTRDVTGNVTDVTRTDTDTDTEAEGEKSKTRTRKRGASESSVLNAKALSAEGVDRQVAADWLTLRKAKRLPLTQTAWDTVKEEAAKIGMSPADAVKYAVDEGWAGFKATWVERQRADGGATHARAGSQPVNKQESLEARNRDVAARAAARFQSQHGGIQQ
ncbi:hypothetical protein [Burkholderia vietnamiensis]|uniref:hypothetical protein n=1 Tax=Burkholderia vietnamiensis TaxID=60552 RepID=UPI001CF0F21D|nr:hypothetical protein [Burkholderia vietnamiensis]MCA7945591.1 hypothetical protein [Burkholderia vietnamiensis]